MKFVQNRITLITDNRTTIFAILMFILLHCGAWQLYAQEWTEPVNISNLSNHYHLAADMAIDNNGNIHVVWSMHIVNNHWKIMYTRSEDDGETWSQSCDLLNNNDLWMSQPHITVDSQNNLYVTYDHATGTSEKMVYLITFNGFNWSNPILVSEGQYGSDYNKIVADEDDRVIVFWNLYSYYLHYRILDHGVWSERYCPFCDSTTKYLLSDGARGVVTNEILHFSGISSVGFSMNEIPTYFSYYLKENIWAIPEIVSIDTINVHIDISLNSKKNPQVVYRRITSTSQPSSDLTATVEKIESIWNEPQIVAWEDRMQKNQRIVIDHLNNPHIVELSYKTNDAKLMHYQMKGDYWIGQIIDSSTNFCNPTKLLFHQNKLYLVYIKDHIPLIEEDDIFFTKYDILTHIPEVKHKPAALQIYPNPAHHMVTIAFEVEQQQRVTVSVLDIAGMQIKQVINTVLPSGAHSFTWNGTDNSGRPVKSGTYLVQLQTKQGSTTQAVEIAR